MRERERERESSWYIAGGRIWERIEEGFASFELHFVEEAEEKKYEGKVRRRGRKEASVFSQVPLLLRD